MIVCLDFHKLHAGNSNEIFGILNLYLSTYPGEQENKQKWIRIKNKTGHL